MVLVCPTVKTLCSVSYASVSVHGLTSCSPSFLCIGPTHDWDPCDVTAETLLRRICDESEVVRVRIELQDLLVDDLLDDRGVGGPYTAEVTLMSSRTVECCAQRIPGWYRACEGSRSITVLA